MHVLGIEPSDMTPKTSNTQIAIMNTNQIECVAKIRQQHEKQ